MEDGRTIVDMGEDLVSVNTSDTDVLVAVGSENGTHPGSAITTTIKNQPITDPEFEVAAKTDLTMVCLSPGVSASKVGI